MYKSPTLVPILNQINSIHARSPLLEEPFQKIFLSTPISSKWSLSFRLPHQKPRLHLSCLLHVLHTPPISLFLIFIRENKD